jgi:hypothetical protein
MQPRGLTCEALASEQSLHRAGVVRGNEGTAVNCALVQTGNERHHPGGEDREDGLLGYDQASVFQGRKGFPLIRSEIEVHMAVQLAPRPRKRVSNHLGRFSEGF